MSFAGCEEEIRSRFAESLGFLNYLRQISPQGFSPLDDVQKAMRGLFIVSIYAAFERGVNAVTEAFLIEIAGRSCPSKEYIPSLQGIVHFPKIKSLRQGAFANILDASTSLFEASISPDPVVFLDNPLVDRLQNVDGSTLDWVCRLFGITVFECNSANRGRLRTLRERRNAVAHGREAASKVGERYTLDELANVYSAADSEITRFRLAVHDHYLQQGYMRQVA